MRNEELEIRNECGGFAANIYGAMPERKWIEGFPFESTKHCLVANDKDFSLTLEMTIRESFLVTSP